MPRYFEFNDSLLESVEQDAERVTIDLRALRTETKGEGKQSTNHLRQQIRLVLEGAEFAVDSPNLPSWLMEGSFRADSLDPDDADRGPASTIPVSLRSASGVELTLSGLHEASGDFVTIRVRAESLTLQSLGDPQSLQHTRASV